MTQSSKTVDTLNDRIKLPFTFDVARMTAEIQALNLGNYIYYDSRPLRSPAHLVDPTIPFPPPAEDFADGSWTDWLDTSILKKCPYLVEVVDFFREHTKVNLVRLLRLAPGAVVKEHTDPTLGLHIEKSVIRLTIPIITNEAVEFFLNGEIVPMQLGECWYLRLTDPHKINNHGTTERINLTIDMIPNEWVRSTILNS
ncbi:MAG: aspartyl/asparaginyl beta-hydroxylase domain-containing protein [Saprospiraceae bacterium]